MPSPLDKYRSRYFGSGGSPLDKYRQRYGIGGGDSTPMLPDLDSPSLASELWKRTKEVGGGILNATGAGAGAIAGAGAAAFGSDIYSRTLMRKAQEAALSEDPGVFQGLDIAPKVGELLTENWQPESVGGQALKNVASLGGTLVTDPGSFLGGAPGRVFGAAATAIYGPEAVQGAWRGATGAAESLGKGNVLDAAGQAVEATLMGGLAALMAKGTISEVQAFRAMRRARGENPNIDASAPPPDEFFNPDDAGEPVAAPSAIPSVFQDAPEVAQEPRGRVFVGQPDGPPTSVETRPRTFRAGPEGTVAVAPQIALGEVPPVFGDQALPDGTVAPEQLSPFGEAPLDEYIPEVFRQEAPLPEVLAPRARRARKPKAVEAPVEVVPEPVVEEPIPGVITVPDALGGRSTTYEARIAQIDEWIDGIDGRLEEGQDPALESLKAELVAEREKLAAPGRKGSLEGAEEVPGQPLDAELPTGDIPAEPLADTVPEVERLVTPAREASPVEAPTSEVVPPAAGPDPALIATRSREGYSAKELAKELGLNEEEIRLIRKEAGISNADVVEGRKKRFAKPIEDARPLVGTPSLFGHRNPLDAPVEAAAPAGEAPALAPTRAPLDVAQDFLAGKESVQEGEIREALKAGGVTSGLEIKSTLQQLETLGIITKAGGKTRRVRPSAESVRALPEDAAATEEAGAPSSPAIPPAPGVGEAPVGTGADTPEAAPAPAESGSDVIPMGDLVKGGVYNVRFGNFDKAVYAGDGRFIGIREKGRVRFLEGGKHPEVEKSYMAVQPLEKVGQVPADIPLRREIGEGPRNENKALFDYLDKGEQQETVAPLTPDQQAKQDLYVDPATGQLRPEIQRQVRAAAKKAMGKRGRTFDEIYDGMVSQLPEIIEKFDPAKGKLTQHVLKRLEYNESHGWEKAQRDTITTAEGLDEKPTEDSLSAADKVAVPPNQETGVVNARKEAQHRALQEALNSLDAKELLIARELKGLGGEKSGDEVGALFGVSKQRINVIKKKIVTKLAASMKEMGHTNFEGHTPDTLNPDGWLVAAAEAADAVHPIEGTDLTFIDTPNLPEGHAAEMAASRETRKMATLSRRIYDEIQAAIGGGTRSRFSGFMAGTNALGVHIGDKVSRADGRVFLNLFRHAEAAFNNPVKGLHSQEVSASIVDTLVHEALHNTYPHGPEMVKAEAATLDRLLRDGTYAKLTNQVKQTINAYDGYLLKWLRERADYAEKNYGKPETAPGDVRGAGEGGAPTGTDRPGARAPQAGDGARSGARPPEGVRGGDQGQAQDLGPGAPVRPGGADSLERDLRAAERYRVEARLDDDPTIRAARDAFADTTLKDIAPHKLRSMMPEISGKLTPEVFNELIEAGDTIGPPPPTAKPGGKPDAPLNIMRIIADDDLKTKMLAMDSVLTKHGLFDRQHKQSWATTEELLETLGGYKNNKELVAHIKRYGATPREITLLRMMHVFQAGKARQANDVFKVAKAKLEEAAAKGTPSPDLISAFGKAAQNRFVEGANYGQLTLDLSGEKTKIGRLLQSLKQSVDGMDPHMANFTAHARFIKALELQGVTKDVRQKLHDLLVSDDPKAYDEFTNLFRESMRYSTTEKLMEAYVAGLVSGVPTKIANFGSNLLFRGLRDAENLLSVGLDAGRAALTNTPRERFLGEASAALAGYKHHFEGAIKDWGAAHGEIATLKPLQARGLKFISGTPLDEAFRSGGKIPGKLGELLRYGFKSMEADDGLFKHMSGGQELWRRIYRQGRQNGLDHAEAMAAVEPRVKEIVQAHESGDIGQLGKDTVSMLKDVNRQVLSDTFQSPLEGLMAKIQLLSNHHPLTKLLVPFIKTPTNLFMQTWKRTPMGLMQTLANKGKYTQGQFAEELSKGVMGTTIAAGIAMMAYEMANNPDGEYQITGSGPIDTKLNAQLRATGWQPYSFKVKDRYIPFTRAEPLSSILGIAADMAHAVKDGEINNVNKLGARLVKSTTTNLANKTFISGVTAAAQAWSEPDRYMERFISQFESGLIPLSGLSRTMTRALDPTYRETGFSDSKFGVAAPIVANIPGASKLLPAQFDPSGAERQRPGTSGLERGVSPVPSTVEDRTPKGDVLRLLTEVGYAPVVKDDFISRKFGRIPLQDEEKAALHKAHERANRALESIIRDPSFLSLPDSRDDPEAFGGRKTKEDVIRSVHDRHYQAALKGLLPVLTKRAITKNRPVSG